MRSITNTPVFQYAAQSLSHSRLGTFFIYAALLSAPGCAKIADPLPPEILVPEAATDLMARQYANHIILSVSLPQRNTNGTAVTTLKSVEVYRLLEDFPGSDSVKKVPETLFRQTADPIMSIPETRISEFRRENLLVFEDTLSGIQSSLLFKRVFRYAVLFVNKKNQAAGFSNQAVIAPIAIPPPPEKISARVSEDSIHLQWTHPEKNMNGSEPSLNLGYNVYRTTDPEKFPAKPVNSSPLKKMEFKDVHFEFDRTYYYRVSVVGSLRNSTAESAPSEDLTVTPRDVFPPLPVENFSAIQDDGTVLLVWYPSPSADTAGYRIYRMDTDSGTEQPLQEKLLRKNSFRDTDTVSGKKYSYTIKAIDAHGNESSGVVAGIIAP